MPVFPGRGCGETPGKHFQPCNVAAGRVALFSTCRSCGRRGCSREFAYQSKLVSHSPTVNARTTATAMSANILSVSDIGFLECSCRRGGRAANYEQNSEIDACNTGVLTPSALAAAFKLPYFLMIAAMLLPVQFGEPGVPAKPGTG
jgi:hypothetical protein